MRSNWDHQRKLAVYNSRTREEGVNAMELVTRVGGELYYDLSRNASPVITGFILDWNYHMSNPESAILQQTLPYIADSKGSKEVENRRAEMGLNWLVREAASTWALSIGEPKLAQSLAEYNWRSDKSGAMLDSIKDDLVRKVDFSQTACDGIDSHRRAVQLAASAAADAAAYAAAEYTAKRNLHGYNALAVVRVCALIFAQSGLNPSPVVEKLQKSALRLVHKMLEV